MQKIWTLVTCAALVCLSCWLAPGEAAAQGAITNGANHTGTIVALGGVDTWTFDATAGDTVIVSIARSGGDTNFAPQAVIRNPANALLGTASSGATAGQIQLSLTVTGTYSVTVQDDPLGQAYIGSYVLRLAKSPGAFTVPGGDEGGAMTNGANHPGLIELGDVDMWSFQANAGETFVLSVADTDNSASFTPQLRVFGPTGSYLGAAEGSLADQIQLQATVTGTYTVVVSAYTLAFAGTGHYMVRLAKSPGVFTAPGGDDGGPMTNGANHPGLIELGDLDMWSFQANAGETFVLSVADTDNDASFTPQLRVFGPTGAYLGAAEGSLADQIQLQATVTGTYTVVVSAYTLAFAGTGHYMVRLAKSPGVFTAPGGDDGGPMTNGANHPGLIELGDLDMWSFQANAGETFVLSVADTDNDASFTPQLRVFGPTGAYLGAAEGSLADQIQLQASVTGTYTVVVSAYTLAFAGTGHYMVRLAKSPGAFTAPGGDEGGTMTNGANHPGLIEIGDLDMWSFDANAGETFVLSVADTDNSASFTPQLRVFGPTGAYLGAAEGSLADQIQLQASVTGTYTVVVSAYTLAFAGTGHYMVRLSKNPGAITVPTGDEGGAMTNGANHAGVIALGDLDLWSFQATAGDTFVLSVADTDNDAAFTPQLRVFGPTGAYLGAAEGSLADQIQLQATVTGTYTVVVSAYTLAFAGTGHYIVRLAKNPGAFVTPTGDDGGTLINGANHPGLVELGDLDLWSFQATAGETFVLSIADTDNSASFTPQLRVFGPTGAYLGAAEGSLADQIQLQASVTGTYSVVVSAYTLAFAGTGHYMLRLAKSPGAFTIPTGDDGGALHNGTLVGGTIGVADLDMWSFVATAGSHVSLALANPDSGSTLVPEARLFGPTGAYLAALVASPTDSSNITIAVTGRYTIVVSSYSLQADRTGTYTLVANGILNDVRGTMTTLTPTPSTIALGNHATATVTVTDIDSNTTSNPAGQVAITSAVPTDGFSSTACTLVAVPATIDRSSCQVTTTPATTGTRTLTAIYAGSGTHLGSSGTGSLTATGSGTPTTTTVTIPNVPFRDNPQTITVGIHIDGGTPVNEGTLTVNVKRGAAPVGDPASAPVFNSKATVNYILPGGLPAGDYTVLADYSGGPNYSASSATGTLTIVEQSTYSLAEGATGSFFHTDLLLANPNTTAAPIRIDFLKEDGSTVTVTQTLSATSRTTIAVETIAGMESTSFSTVVTSLTKVPLIVERTMHWDASGYGSSSEKANEGVASTWYFAEGSQGFFHTFFLLLNPQPTPNVAHVTYVFEDATSLQRDYAMAPTSRFTVDGAADPALLNRSFGATVVFDQPGMAERSMYFGSVPLFSGGTAAAGVTAPATTWRMAEGATGSFFNTFILIANPNAEEATVTMTYLLDNGSTVTRPHTISGHQRLTINVATEDASLASAAFGTTVQADQPVVVERSQYWPVGNWNEAHNSMAVFALGPKWGLAEGRVGGPGHTQTYVLVANPNPQPAQLTVTFLRTDGTTIVKNFTVAPTSRFNISVTGPGGGTVPELSDESFGTVIESTQPVLVERSMYSDANGVTWAAGTNATGTRLP